MDGGDDSRGSYWTVEGDEGGLLEGRSSGGEEENDKKKSEAGDRPGSRGSVRPKRKKMIGRL